MIFLVLSTVVMSVFCQNKLPTPPEVIFGGFIPIFSKHKIEDEQQLERNSKSLTKYVHGTSGLLEEPSFSICKLKLETFLILYITNV